VALSSGSRSLDRALRIIEMDDGSVPNVMALLIMDGEGGRLICKYYGGFMPTAAERTDFEAKLFKKTKHTAARSEAEIIMMDNLVAIFRASADSRFYLIGSAGENELILTCVLDALHDALHTLLRGQLERRSLLDALETLTDARRRQGHRRWNHSRGRRDRLDREPRHRNGASADSRFY
jgi:hypothetical protein